MRLTGVTLGGEPTARWLEAEPKRVDCVEVVAEGFFARNSPYLRWLGAQHPLLIRASTLSIGTPGTLDPERLAGLTRLCDTANAHWIVYPLGCSVLGDLRLAAPVPISLTPQSLETVSTHVAMATTASGRPGLIEPIASPLRVPGSLTEPDFLVRLCETTGARLLIDVTTLLTAARNHRIDPEDWLSDVPSDLIAAIRIGGSSVRSGRWRRDPEAEIDPAAWALLDAVLSRCQPDVRLLDHREHSPGLNVLTTELARLQLAENGSSPPPSRSDAPRASAVRPSSDVALFVLDSEGVFFAESRRELMLFNTAATLVWCLIEDGQSVAQIAEGYQRAFDVTEIEASRQTGTILRHWFGRGYIDYPGPLDADSVSLTTALGQLLTNAQLRAAFRRAPYQVARQLSVASEDAGHFTAMDPDQLDAQAEEFTWVEAQQESLPPVRDDAPAGLARTPTTLAGHYRLLSTTFAIETGSEPISSGVREALAHLETQDPNPDVVLQIRPSAPDRWVVLDRDETVAECADLSGIVPAVKQLVRQIAVDRHPFLVSVHAGVVSFGNGCVLLPAAAGSGKTTLTAALIHFGATYFSDEIALLDEATLAVSPVPLSLTVKDGSLGPLRPLFPAIDTLPVHLREDHVRVRYLRPPPSCLPDAGLRTPARWVVFPRFEPAADTALQAVDRPVALRRLLDESFVCRPRLTRANAESLVRWMRGVECYELPFSHVGAAAMLLRGLMTH